MSITGKNKRFLFLQGPHGPFFSRLSKILKSAGADVWRIGFNRGDQAFWPDKDSYIAFDEPQGNWVEFLNQKLSTLEITDLVLYGDTRPVHARAIEIAKKLGITIHVFEEGYLRPYWVTYERNGSNGYSRLMDLDVQHMQTVLQESEMDVPEAPAHWGDMRHHIFYGALYHWFVMFRNGRYRNFQPHRALSVGTELRLYLTRLALMPFFALDRMISTARIKNGGYPYHLVLLQLEHDSSFRIHSPFETSTEFLELVIKGFAEGASPHHHLVFKAHPLESGQVPLSREIERISRVHGVDDRVHYVRGGKLAQLLDHARSAVTVNSTAAQQVLWRGLPLKIFGRAVYAKPEFVSSQSVSDFFAAPQRPGVGAYRDYRHYLLETSQVPGGFYSRRGRRQLLRQVVDMMLSKDDPYEALERGTAAPRQQLRVIK